MRRVILFFLLLGAINLVAQEKAVVEGSVSFKIKNLGTYAKGSFSKSTFSGNFALNNLENSAVNVTIQVNSIDTGIKKRDKHLLEDDYFDAAKHPTITFKSVKIEKISATSYRVHGDLKIKGTTKALVLPLVLAEKENKIVLSAAFELRRRDFGVGGRSWILSDKVKANVQFTVAKG